MVAIPLFKHRLGAPNVDIVQTYAASQRLARVLTPKNQNEKIVLYLIIALIGAMALAGFLATKVH